jgi:integrase/recombinase XerD
MSRSISGICARSTSLSHSTVRSYQSALRRFTSYVSNPDYGWDRVCEQRFGTHPAQVFFDWNTASHTQEYEASPSKRPFTRHELQMLFDHADDQVELIAASGKKGWQAAYRDAVMLKVAYSYGLRFNELRHLQTIDFATNPQARRFGKPASARSATANHARAPRTNPAAS